MKKQYKNICFIFLAVGMILFFGFLPYLQTYFMDHKTLGKEETLSLHSVQISEESKQTTLEKLEIVQNHAAYAYVRPSVRTADDRNLFQVVVEEGNRLLKEMGMSVRLNQQWKLERKKLCTYISQEESLKEDGTYMSDIHNLLVWNVMLKNQKGDTKIYFVLDAYTNQILAVCLDSDPYKKKQIKLAVNPEDIRKGFFRYLGLSKEYRAARKGKIKYSTDTVEELHLKENGKETSLFVYWDASGFQINDVYEG